MQMTPERGKEFSHAMKLVTEFTGINDADILSDRRFEEQVQARHLVWWLLNVRFYWSFALIGRKFYKDHTTVMHGVNKVVNNELYRGLEIKVDFNPTIIH